LGQILQQLQAFWQNQTFMQRLVLIILVIATAVLVPIFISWASTPSYSVAFSGLSETEAGNIVERLAEENISYKLQGSGTILVPSDKNYEVRLMMAREGLLQGGTVGFELFSGSTLGMTDFSERVNYQRALAGELERTIGSLNAIEAVRVHIVTPEKSLLSSEQIPVTASVTLKISPTGFLDTSQVRSITHLVASSVENLLPENVTVIDVNGNLLASGVSSDEASASTIQSDNRRAAEAAYATELEQKIHSLLNTVLGPNRSVVKANVSLDWTEREVTTQSYVSDPETIRSHHIITENYSGTGELPGGIPGAETNLPLDEEEEEETETTSEGSLYQRTEETTNYEITQTQEHETINPGKINRISLAVLVDGVSDPDSLATLQASIVAAAGIDTERDDIISVETLAFDQTYYEEQEEEMAKDEKTDLYFTIGQGVLAGLIVIAMLWYAQRQLSKLRLSSNETWTPILQPVSELALTGSERGSKLENPQVGHLLDAQQKASSKKSSSGHNEKMELLINRLAEDQPANVAEILNLWISEDRS
jgi:flagellar M-ring protein FliF